MKYQEPRSHLTSEFWQDVKKGANFNLFSKPTLIKICPSLAMLIAAFCILNLDLDTWDKSCIPVQLIAEQTQAEFVTQELPLLKQKQWFPAIAS